MCLHVCVCLCVCVSFSPAEFLSGLGQYEIAVPVRVGPQGQPLEGSEEDGPPQARRRRRSADGAGSQGSSSPQIFYQLSTPRSDFLLNLTLRDNLLSKQFRVEYWRRGQVAWSHAYSPNCHYVGHLQDRPHSSQVALSNCNGLVSTACPRRLWGGGRACV